MLFDNLGFRYYEAVRDYPRYKLATKSFSKFREEVTEALQTAEKKQRLSVVASTRKLDEGIYKYLYMGFDAEDAEHLVLAIDLLHAKYLITKDHDFTSRKDDLKRKNLTVILPSEMLKELGSGSEKSG
jgi:predicted nucleic acid-binding protein